MRKTAFQIIALLFACSCGHAQELNYIHYTTNNSKLPHDIVYRIIQDSAGYMWICTDDGMIRFDGSEMVSYQAGFNSNYTISADYEQKRIWVSTWKGGLYYVDENDTAVPLKVPHNPFAVFNSNGLIVFNDLIISYTFKTYVVYQFIGQNTIVPIALKFNRDSNFIVEPGQTEYYQFLKTSDHRLFAYNKDQVYEVTRDHSLVPIPCDYTLDDLWQSPGGTFYYRHGWNIYETDETFSYSRQVFAVDQSLFPEKEIIDFVVLPSGNVCAGMGKPDPLYSVRNYFLFNVRTGEVIDLAKEMNLEAIAAYLTVDKEGNLWISTDGDGLYLVYDKKYPLIGGNVLLENTNITDMYYHPSNGLYIGTKVGVYTYRDRILKRVENFPYEHYHVDCFSHTPEGEVIVSAKTITPGFVIHPGPLRRTDDAYVLTTPSYVLRQSTLFERDKKTGETDYNKPVYILGQHRDVAEGENGRLWFAAYTGLQFYDPGKKPMDFKPEVFGNCTVNDLLYENGRGLWVATNRGLYLVFRSGDHTRFEHTDGLSNDNINCLFLQSPGKLWVGSQNGLFFLGNGQVEGILKRRDGLIADDVTCFAGLPHNELAAGSSKGISFIPMEVAFDHTFPPEVIVEEIFVNEKEQLPGTLINVPFGGTFSIRYNAVTFVYPELLSFEYRLNEDEPWIKTQNKSLVLTNLKTNEYELQIRVKKYNSDFCPPVTIAFEIHSPWWWNPYFIACAFLLVTAASYLILHLRAKKQRESLRIKQELSALRLKALQTQLNPHFISNCLNAIQYFTLKQDEIAANESLTRFADLTRLLLETSRSKFVTLKTEIEITTLYLGLEKMRFENKFDYALDISPEIELEKVVMPGMLLQPFAENSVNHGLVYLDREKRGMLSISVYKLNEGINIVIDDNGIGRARAKEIRARVKKSYRSRSTEIISEMQNTVNSIPGCALAIHTIDKTDAHEQSMGTSVSIFLNINPVLSRSTI